MEGQYRVNSMSVFNIFKNKLNHQQLYVLHNKHTNNDGFKSTLDKELSRKNSCHNGWWDDKKKRQPLCSIL